MRRCRTPTSGSGMPTTPCMKTSSAVLLAMRGRSRRRSSRVRRALVTSSVRWTGRRPRTACWCSACTAAWRRTANCRRCAKCAAFPSPARARRRRILPSTRWPPSVLPRSRASSAGWHRAGGHRAALAEHGKLIAKPAKDGSSYGLIFVNSSQDIVAVRNAAKTEEYLIEPFIAGVEATCGVLEQSTAR